MRILYLKDDSCTRKCPQADEMNRYEVVEATSFDDALGLLRTAWFDVLLIDDGNDPETVQFIVGARAVQPDLPVFVLSAWGIDLGRVLRVLIVRLAMAISRDLSRMQMGHAGSM